MPKKKSTRPTSIDQDSGAPDPSMVDGAGESTIKKEIDDLTSELASSDAPASPRKKSQSKPAPEPAEKTPTAPEQAPENASAPPQRPKLSAIELAALGLIGVVILGFAIFLFTIPDDDLPTSDDIVRAASEVPSSASGDLVSLNSIVAHWRPLTDSDRTDKSSDLLPELVLKVSQKNTSAPSFLKVYFIDPMGEISGDVRTARIEGGKLVDTGRGEKVSGADQVAVYGSKGLKDKNAFLAYRYSGEESWAVQIFEGADYSDGPWNQLAFFEIPDTIKGAESPE